MHLSGSGGAREVKMSKVSMTLTSEIPTDDLEAILEALKPIITMIGSIEVHTEILEED